MREFKFRAWDKERECWYKPIHEAYKGNLFELLVGFEGDLFAHTMCGTEHESLWPGRFELMQYTGLKDSQGVEIYEGDIVELYSDEIGSDIPENFKGVVTYSGSGFHVFSEESCVGFELWQEIARWRIIGNIYENQDRIQLD
ncbi:putative phage protein (TIGR01671 family) [Anaerosolibacter carboniphilus]|uniref:Putative phage protein (TIGR01671 family) n=1 Tax=Anaerosolibacter carboniphilus TaxID=1417629 RepID=A0A841KX51_9FIRM|nr:YopX family protein [Anaerosolibacter carboniphilus]MBB6218204.1 putative phage protein (TIGR01671 family) [Anaerosolibacter carboniphilus]